MKEELVSIIIPVYNVLPYLENCLNSVLNQTYKNIEVILINDGSTDGSGEICDKYASQDERIIVFHQKNRGQSVARNVGLELAKGKYVSFVDSDDYINKKMIEKLYNNKVENGFVMCQKTQVDESDNILCLCKKVKEIEIGKREYLHRLKNNPDYVVVWGKLYDKTLFEDITFLEDIQYEDEDIMPQLVYNSKKIQILSEGLYFYRVRANSTMTQKYSRKNLDIIDICEKRIVRYKEWKMYSMYKWAVKDYYLQLIKLLAKAEMAKDDYGIGLIRDKLFYWSNYGVKFSLLDRVRYKKILRGGV